MTIPNVYMGWCKRKATCRWCSYYIEAGNPMVTAFFWHKGNEDKRWWNTKLYFHPQCWVDQGLDYLKMNPYVPYIRHKRPTLTKKLKAERLVLLRRKAALDQRKRNIRSDYPDRVLIDARLNKQIAELMVEIALVGGVPKKWLESLT